jgi:hypothetical protein
MTSFKIAHHLQGNFKICASAFQLSNCFCAGLFDVGNAPASWNLCGKHGHPTIFLKMNTSGCRGSMYIFSESMYVSPFNGEQIFEG